MLIIQKCLPQAGCVLITQYQAAARKFVYSIHRPGCGKRVLYAQILAPLSSSEWVTELACQSGVAYICMLTWLQQAFFRAALIALRAANVALKAHAVALCSATRLQQALFKRFFFGPFRAKKARERRPFWPASERAFSCWPFW